MLFGLWAMWKRRLPLPVTVYTLGILALMLLPQTVTARPRFLFTAFPLLIAVAADLARSTTTRCGRCCWPRAAPAWPP